jgi:hypothetical protein
VGRKLYVRNNKYKGPFPSVTNSHHNNIIIISAIHYVFSNNLKVTATTTTQELHSKFSTSRSFHKMQFPIITLLAFLAAGISALPAESPESTVAVGTFEAEGATFYGEVNIYVLFQVRH